MIERLLTFAELSKNRDVLEGKLVKFPVSATQICIGEVIATAWWPERHIQHIHLAECKIWDDLLKKWAPWNPVYKINFAYGDFEMFSGPYETAEGELFFIYNEKLYVHFFPKPLKPDRATGFEALCAVHNRIMNPAT